MSAIATPTSTQPNATADAVAKLHQAARVFERMAHAYKADARRREDHEYLMTLARDYTDAAHRLDSAGH